MGIRDTLGAGFMLVGFRFQVENKKMFILKLVPRNPKPEIFSLYWTCLQAPVTLRGFSTRGIVDGMFCRHI